LQVATVTYKTQMGSYTGIVTCNVKIVVTKKRQNAKNSPNMIAYSFFDTRKHGDFVYPLCCTTNMH